MWHTKNWKQLLHFCKFIIGNIIIGNNVLIAPGAFVNFNVPENSIVIGNPGKIIQRNSSPTKKYIVYPINYDKDS